MARPTVVANTDRAWFDHFRSADTPARVDEVNFWRPQTQSRYRALAVGELLFLRLKHPVNPIAGFGFFALETFLAVQMAWEVFREKNGDPFYERFARRVTGTSREIRDDCSRAGSGGSGASSCMVRENA